MNFIKKHKALSIVLGIIFFIVIAIGTISYLSGNNNGNVTSNNTASQNGGSSSSPSNQKSINSPTFNPLINNDELNRVQKAYNTNGTPQPKYNFNYHLSPQLTDKKTSMIIQSADAASNCDVNNAPATVTVYTLKSNLTNQEAQTLATTYGITAAPASIPTDNNSSFQYYFGVPNGSAFLAVTASSGTTYFHVAPPPPATGSATPTPATLISQAQAQTISDTALAQHNINANITFIGANADGSGKNFQFNYTKNYGFKMIDSSSLASTQPICDIPEATTMNTIESIVSNNGTLWKLINTTRTITGKYTLPRESLTDAITEYKNNPVIPPVVVGGGTATTGDVTINQATLVNYDYGDSYGQASYVPLYLTSGTTAAGATVLTLFPAISKADLAKTPIPDLVNSHNTLQLDTFNPPPAAVPAAPQTGTATNTSINTSGRNICYGGEVDYEINCKDANGQSVCEADPSSTQDPFGVCTNGCQEKSGTVTTTAGQDACTQFIQQNNIPPDDGFSGFGNPFRSAPAGTYTCQVRGCPC